MHDSDKLSKIEKQDKLDKMEKQDKLDKLEKMEHAQMLSKLREVMVLDKEKEYEYYMEDEGLLVCGDLLRKITSYHQPIVV